MRSLYLTSILLLFSCSASFAQDVLDVEEAEPVKENVFFKTYFKGFFSGFSEGEPFSINGGIGLNARSYSAWGIEDRQPPFYWILNANLNFKIRQLNIPFSALVSIDRKEVIRRNLPGLPDIRENYTRRFNRIGASPNYKWAKLHFGHRNMNFSQFTLSNLTYLGAGTELTPGNVRVAFMYGRLADAEPMDLSLTEPNLPIFRRWGWGTKIGYGDRQNFIDLIAFKAWDDLNSIPEPTPQEVFTNENLVMGVKAQKMLFNKLRLLVDYAGSALTPDNTQSLSKEDKFPYFGFLYDARMNTQYRNALETSGNYLGKGFNIGLKYRRIDPNYRSLGAYFFNNDIEDYTANASFGLFKQSVQVSGSAGIQRDNLDDSKPATLSRFVGSTNIYYTGDQFNLGLNYSNYSSDIEYVLNTELDSLNVVMVTQDLGANATYSFGKEKGNRHSLTLMTNIQSATDDIVDPQQSGESKILNVNLVYTLMVPVSNWSFTNTWNYHQNELSMMQVNRWGAGIGVSKNLLKNKLSLGANLNFFKATAETVNSISNSTINWRLRANYRVNEHHTFNFNYNLLNRNKSVNNGPKDAFTEGIGNFGYQYVFGWKSKRDEEKR